MCDIAAPRRESSDDRRIAIARAARALIAEKGFEGLRTRDIAERVGINVATLHYHVPTKAALIDLVCASMRREFMDQHLVRPRSHLSAREQMDLEFVDFGETLAQQPDLLMVLSELTERSRRDERVAAAILPMQQKWHGMVADLLRQGMAEGAYRPDMDAHAAATMIVGALTGYFRSYRGDASAYAALVAELQRAIRNPSRRIEE